MEYEKKYAYIRDEDLYHDFYELEKALIQRRNYERMDFVYYCICTFVFNEISKITLQYVIKIKIIILYYYLILR